MGRALGLLDHFAREMRTRFHPDLVVDMGDRINDVSLTEDARRITQVVQRVQSVGVPALFLHGNHDVPNLDRGTINQLLGRTADYESLDYGSVHLVLLNSQDPTFEGGAARCRKPACVARSRSPAVHGPRPGVLPPPAR